MEKMKFEVKFADVQKINPLFSKCKIYVMYVGDNRNMSSFTKEAVMTALPTLYNCPIIGEYNETVEDFRGHGGKVEITSDGVQFIQTTKPYGLIPESSNFSWENVMEKDGTMHEYLVAEGYLWTGRYPEAQRIIEQGNGQSMEIEDCMGEYRSDSVFQIDSFLFSALCILGNDVEPCFESSQVVGYSLDKDKFKFEFNQMVTELKKSFKESGENMENEEIVVEEVVTEEVETEVVETEEVETFETTEETEVVEETEEVEEIETEETVEESFEQVVEETEEVEVVEEEVVISNEDKIFDLNKKLVELTQDFANMEVETVALREYKRINELSKDKLAKDELIAEFSVGLTVDEMKPVTDKSEEISLGDMKVKLNEIFTIKNLTSLKKKFTKEADEVILSDIPKKEVIKSRYAV